MKKLLLIALLVVCSLFTFGQSRTICCAKSAPQQFAMLASNRAFVMSHPLPRHIHLQSSIGKAITYKTAGGPDANRFYLSDFGQQRMF